MTAAAGSEQGLARASPAAAATMSSTAPATTQRRRKTAAERRQQRLRAEARALQHVLRCLRDTAQHRGGALTCLGAVFFDALQTAVQRPQQQQRQQQQSAKPQPATVDVSTQTVPVPTVDVATYASMEEEAAQVVAPAPAPDQRAIVVQPIVAEALVPASVEVSKYARPQPQLQQSVAGSLATTKPCPGQALAHSGNPTATASTTSPPAVDCKTRAALAQLAQRLEEERQQVRLEAAARALQQSAHLLARQPGGAPG